MAFNHAQWLSHITSVADRLSAVGLYSLFFLYSKSKPGRVISFSAADNSEVQAFTEIKDFMKSGFHITSSEDGLCTLGGNHGSDIVDSITYIELIASNLEHFSLETITSLEQICERIDVEMMHHRRARERGTTSQWDAKRESTGLAFFIINLSLAKIFLNCFSCEAREANCAEPYLTYGERQFDWSATKQMMWFRDIF